MIRLNINMKNETASAFQKSVTNCKLVDSKNNLIFLSRSCFCHFARERHSLCKLVWVERSYVAFIIFYCIYCSLLGVTSLHFQHLFMSRDFTAFKPNGTAKAIQFFTTGFLNKSTYRY